MIFSLTWQHPAVRFILQYCIFFILYSLFSYPLNWLFNITEPVDFAKTAFVALFVTISQTILSAYQERKKAKQRL